MGDGRDPRPLCLRPAIKETQGGIMTNATSALTDSNTTGASDMTDMINRPPHYVDGRKYEPLNVIEDWGLNYRLGSALKYISRAGRKDPSKYAEDLRKAVFYLERERDAFEDQQAPCAVTHEDVLEDQAACAAEGEEYNLEQSLDRQYGLWMDHVSEVAAGPLADFWDPSLGPVEPPEEKEEFIAIIERHHFPRMGVRADGSTVVLPDDL